MRLLPRWFNHSQNVRRSRASARNRVRPTMEPLEQRLALYSATGNAWPDPQTITISFMPDGTSIDGYVSNLYSTFNSNSRLASTWQTQILKAAQTWAQSTNINFVVVPDSGVPEGAGSYQQGDPTQGDIRIGGYNFGTSTLAAAFQPPSINNYPGAGDIFFNTAQTFNVGTTFDLYTVALHEFGHALGLGHSDTSGYNAMYPMYNGVRTQLSSDDIAGIQSIYSNGSRRNMDRYATVGVYNNMFYTAANVNGFINPTTLTGGVTGLDIYSTADVEYMAVNVPSGTNGSFSFEVQSLGLSLFSPKVTVYGPNESTVLASANGYGHDGTTITASASGVYAGEQLYIVVQGSDSSPFGTGAYDLGMSFGVNPVPTFTNTPVAIPNGTPFSAGGGDALNVDTYSAQGPLVLGITPDTGSSNDDGITNVNTPSVQGSATAGDTVAVYLNGTLVATVIAQAQNTWSTAPLPALPDGHDTFTAVATDPSGNVSALSSGFSVVIDTKPPAPPLITGITRKSGAGASGANGQVLRGTSAPETTVTLYASGGRGHGTIEIGTAAAGSTGTWSYALDNSNLDPGSYQVTATATDVAGNISALSARVHVNGDLKGEGSGLETPVPVTPPAPSLPLTPPIITGVGLSTSGGQTSLTVEGMAEPQVQVMVDLGDRGFGTVSSDANGHWQIDAPLPPEPTASMALTAVTVDPTGDVSAPDQWFGVTFGGTSSAPPTAQLSEASILGIDAMGNVETIATPSLTGQAAPNRSVTILDGNVVLGVVATDASGRWTFTTPMLAQGTHALVVLDKDSTGAINQVVGPLTFRV